MATGGGGLTSGGTSGLGGLFYGNPGYNSTPIDQGTQGLINSQVSGAQGSSPQSFANQDLAGTNQSVDTGAQQNYHNALGGPSDANMQAALQARAQRTMASGVNQLQRQAQIAGLGQQNQMMQNAFGDVTGAQAANNSNNQAQMQAQVNNQATRASIIGSIFSPLGSLLGSIQNGTGALTTMPDGSVAGSGNNFGAGQMSQPTMGDQFNGGAASLSSAQASQGAPSLGNFSFSQ